MTEDTSALCAHLPSLDLSFRSCCLTFLPFAGVLGPSLSHLLLLLVLDSCLVALLFPLLLSLCFLALLSCRFCRSSLCVCHLCHSRNQSSVARAEVSIHPPSGQQDHGDDHTGFDCGLVCSIPKPPIRLEGEALV